MAEWGLVVGWRGPVGGLLTGGSKDGYVNCALGCQLPAIQYVFYLAVPGQEGVGIVGLPFIEEAASGRLMPGCWLAGGCLLKGSWLVAWGC